MASANGVPSGLSGLVDRLSVGLGPATTRWRPPQWESYDLTALAASGFWSDLHHLDGHQPRGAPLGAEDVAAAIRNTADRLRQHRPALLAILLAPGLLPERIVALLEQPDAFAKQVWMWTCWIAEATWLAVAEIAPEDRELLRPVAARLRFLALSEAFRGGHHETNRGLWEDAVGETDLGTVFGGNTAYLLVLRCRQARWEWHRCLDSYQSHPLLAAAAPAEVESEIDLLAFRHSGRGWWATRLPSGSPGTPLVTDWGAVNDANTPLTADDTALLDDVLDRHLLPRMRLLRAIRAATYPGRTVAPGRRAAAAATRWSRRWAGALPLLGAAGVLALAYLGHFHTAAITATASYALLGALVVVFGRIWATAWVLRLPAAGTVGLFALLTLPPHWWQAPVDTWWAPTVLVAASVGYLIVEARNHGVAAWMSIGRALGLAAVGAVHAFMVTVIGLVAIAPALVENGQALRDGWHNWPATAGLSTLCLGTAWCLAVGVFVQILWDDRPITAPLAHLRWRR